MALKYRDIEDAFEMITFDGMSDAAAVVNRVESKLYFRDSLGDNDEIPEDAEDNDDYVWMPDKMDLDLGTSLVFRFAREEIPEKYDMVRNIFRSRGAYSRFKDLLDRIGLLDKWYDFESEQTKTALLNWCKENDIVLEEE